jgi:protein-S-isoprenylcysteine O-methyltransferase Ste14
MKNRTRETCTSGSVRDGDGNILIYSANERGDRGDVGIIRSPVRASILPDFGGYFVYAARREEEIMIAQFPEQYPAYMRRTRMLLPLVL